jgi:hypothetical protein
VCPPHATTCPRPSGKVVLDSSVVAVSLAGESLAESICSTLEIRISYSHVASYVVGPSQHPGGDRETPPVAPRAADNHVWTRWGVENSNRTRSQTVLTNDDSGTNRDSGRIQVLRPGRNDHCGPNAADRAGNEENLVQANERPRMSCGPIEPTRLSTASHEKRLTQSTASTYHRTPR